MGGTGSSIKGRLISFKSINSKFISLFDLFYQGFLAVKVSETLWREGKMICHIRIKGHPGIQWTEWFDGLDITLEDNGDTLLSGPVVDQAALHGLLKKVHDLGMPLISFDCADLSDE
jgi:hypothetical protein